MLDALAVGLHQREGVLEITDVFPGVSEVVRVELGEGVGGDFLDELDDFEDSFAFVYDPPALRLATFEIRIYPHFNLPLCIYSTKPKVHCNEAQEGSNAGVALQQGSQGQHRLSQPHVAHNTESFDDFLCLDTDGYLDRSVFPLDQGVAALLNLDNVGVGLFSPLGEGEGGVIDDGGLTSLGEGGEALNTGLGGVFELVGFLIFFGGRV